MEIMLAFVTDDLHESIWTNQEIGFALGRNIPIVSLKVENKDPDGFIGKQQALKCDYENVEAAAPKIYLLIRDTPSEEVYVLNMFRMRGSRLWGSRLHRACVV